MLVKVIGFSQEMDFEGGDVTNFVTLALPGGKQVKAIVSDDGARTLIEARASAGPLPVHTPVAPPPPPPQDQPSFDASEFSHDEDQDTDEDGAIVFGGNANGAPAPPAEFWTPPVQQQPAAHAPAAQPQTSIAHADPAVQQRLYRQQQQEQKERQRRGPTMGRTVPKDDRGNPIVQNNGGIDVSQVIGGGGGVTDEDGVGQF